MLRHGSRQEKWLQEVITSLSQRYECVGAHEIHHLQAGTNVRANESNQSHEESFRQKVLKGEYRNEDAFFDENKSK